MAMATKLQWLPRLLLLTHSAFFLLSHAAALPWTLDHASGLHPVVLLPGSTCSQIEVRLTDAYEPPSPLCAAHKGDGQWHRLWKTAAAPDADAPCFADQFRLVYDDAAGDYRNAPGVETRAVSFGSTRGFLADDPADKELCMGKLVEALERAGYRDGETLLPSSGSSTSASPVDVLSLPQVRMVFPGTFSALPSPVAFGDDTPLVVTANRSYAARHMPAFLAAAGLPPQAVWLYETRALPVALSLGPPLVPMTCVNGGGVPTVQKLVYPGPGGLGAAPEVVYGDGDGVVNLASILALDTVMGGDPRQEHYRSIRIANMSHVGVVSDALALERLVGEILYAATPAVDARAM